MKRLLCMCNKYVYNKSLYTTNVILVKDKGRRLLMRNSDGFVN